MFFDGWIKLLKTERKYYLHMKCSVSTHVCCRCSLPSWLLVGCNCKIQVCSSCAIVTIITTILVWFKCNKQHRWLDTAKTNMNACRCKYIRHDCWLGATATDMHAVCKHIIKAWLLARCNCNIHISWSDFIVLTSPLVKYEHRAITVCLKQV